MDKFLFKYLFEFTCVYPCICLVKKSAYAVNIIYYIFNNKIFNKYGLFVMWRTSYEATVGG